MLRALKNRARRALESRGWAIQRVGNLPRGQDWAREATRLVTLDAPVILDVGANVGQSTIALHRWFPRATIHAFEPVPSTCDELRRRVASIPNVSVHPYALGATNESVSISAIPLAETNSLRNTVGPTDGDANRVDVQVRTVGSVCEELHIGRISILKSDTEGFDLDVLRGAGSLIANGNVDVVVCEAGADPSCNQHTPMLALLQWAWATGFWLYGVYEQECLVTQRSSHRFCNMMFVRAEHYRAQGGEG